MRQTVMPHAEPADRHELLGSIADHSSHLQAAMLESDDKATTSLNRNTTASFPFIPGAASRMPSVSAAIQAMVY